MTVPQHTVSLVEFAQAMFEADGGFAERVRAFEERFGPVDDDTLAVLAQAAYFCWHNRQYRDNLMQLCRAIGTGKPTRLFSHCQVTPERWAKLNAYVVGVQRWAGIALDPPAGVDSEKVERIKRWLGEPHPAKVALTSLFLSHLIDDLLNYASFAALGESNAPQNAGYADLFPWYARPDGAPYAIGHALAPSDGHRWRWDNEVWVTGVEEDKRRVRHEMRSAPEDAEALIRGILSLTQPPCMHRFSRYLDIQITSIGTLRWRGNLPPDDLPKAQWQALLDEATGTLRAWVAGVPTSGELAAELYAALGKAIEPKKAILDDFFFPDWWPGMENSWDWLVSKARADGTTACTLFEGASMEDEIVRRFVVHEVGRLSYAAAIRALGIGADHVYVLRERIDCSHWKHVAQYFVKPTPRRYVTLQPRKVIEAMRAQGLW